MTLVVLAALGVATPALASAAQIKMSVDPRRVRVGEEIVVTVTASGSIDTLRQPPSGGLPMSTGMKSESYTIMGGRMRAKVEQSFSVVPDKAGTFTIGPAVGLYQGKEVARSGQVTVRVTPAPELKPVTPSGLDLGQFDGRAVFLLATAPKDRVVVGEPFLFGLDLYVRRNVTVRSPSSVQPPSFDGFKRESLLGEDANISKMRRTSRVGQTLYDVYPLDRSLLIGLGPGMRLLGKTRWTIVVARGRSGRRKQLDAVPVRVQVVDPPTSGRPPGYSPGVVGRFRLHGGPDRTRAKVGERVLVDLTVRGTGNLDAVPEPKMKAPAELRAEPIPGRECPERDLADKGYRGHCRFQTVYFPQRAGRFTLGPARIPYFDAASGRYRVATAGPWTLDVAPSTTGPVLTAEPGATPDDGPLEPELIDRLGAQRGGPALPAPPPLGVGYGVPAALSLAMLGFLGMRERREANPARILERIARLARTEIAGDGGGEPRGVSERVRAGLRRVVIAATAVDPQGLSLDQLERKLSDAGVAVDVRRELRAVLEAAEQARFSGGGGGDADLQSRASALISRLVEPRA